MVCQPIRPHHWQAACHGYHDYRDIYGTVVCNCRDHHGVPIGSGWCVNCALMIDPVPIHERATIHFYSPAHLIVGFGIFKTYSDRPLEVLFIFNGLCRTEKQVLSLQVLNQYVPILGLNLTVEPQPQPQQLVERQEPPYRQVET